MIRIIIKKNSKNSWAVGYERAEKIEVFVEVSYLPVYGLVTVRVYLTRGMIRRSCGMTSYGGTPLAVISDAPGKEHTSNIYEVKGRVST